MMSEATKNEEEIGKIKRRFLTLIKINSSLKLGLKLR